MHSLIIDLKEEHLGEWKKLFDETLEEYLPIHNHLRKKFNCLVGIKDGNTYFGSVGDILTIFNYLSPKCVKVIKERYPEIYSNP